MTTVTSPVLCFSYDLEEKNASGESIVSGRFSKLQNNGISFIMFLSVILPGNGMRLHTKVFGAPACVQPVVFSDVVLLCSGWVMSICERQWFSQMPNRLSDEQRKLISYANRFFVLAVGLFHSLWTDLFFGWYGILLIKTWKLICSNSYRRFVFGSRRNVADVKAFSEGTMARICLTMPPYFCARKLGIMMEAWRKGKMMLTK